MAAASPAVNLKHRSTSSSGQFVVYCDDRAVRARVVGFVEEVKSEVLGFLRESDDWKFPIVVSIEPASERPPGTPPVTISLTNTVAGPKIDVAVVVGDDPTKIFLQRHIVRALLLEIAYRSRPPVSAGKAYPNPPWWLAEGIIQTIRNRNGSGEPDIFKSIVNTEKLPSLEKFVGQPPVHLDNAAGAVDRACSMALIEALVHLPNGAQNLGRFLRASPDAGGDTMGALLKNFPSLGESSHGLSKWWTLQLTELAKSGQWRGLTPAATDAELNAALTLAIPMDKAGRTQSFPIADFEKFITLPGAKSALLAAQLRVVTLSTKASGLYRPILAEYEEICRLLAARKMRGIAERLQKMAAYRKSVLQRLDHITDYLNWYEATQTRGPTGQFDKYLRAAEAAAPKPPPFQSPDPRISNYLDALEDDFAPLRPNTMPGPEPGGSASR
jgi:hypothetical protein